MRFGKLTTIVTMLLLVLAASPCPAQSLGEIARELRQQKKESKQPVKVFTNDNLPPPSPWEPVTMGSSPSTVKAEKELQEQPAGGQENKEIEVPPEKKDGKKESTEELEAQLKTARQELASAQEQQQLSEDELNLLQLQQAREGGLDSELHAQIQEKIDAKQTEVETKRAVTAKAQEKVDEIAKKLEELRADKDGGNSEQPAEAQPSEPQPPEAPKSAAGEGSSKETQVDTQ
jgi:DNA repair exonuclease SbcCD ATPase subunit